MRAPAKPVNELERLQDLYAYAVIDSESEQIFEEITELAATICGTRFALLTLIDSEKQFIKSSHGMDFQDTTRDESICGHAILASDVFEVPNIGADERFSENPLLKGQPNLRFYAGGQLRSDRGNAVGMLCVLDSEPGLLDENQRHALRTLSRLVIAILEARRKKPSTPDWLGGWISRAVEEVYIRDPQSLHYLSANEAALRRAGCSLEKLCAGEHANKLEGDVGEFPAFVRRLQSGETTVSFEATRLSLDGSPQRVDVSWTLLRTADSSAILSIVRERQGV